MHCCQHVGWKAAFLSLFAFALPTCLAQVTWTQIECDTISVQGTGMDDIWDNAITMGEDAGTAIGQLTAAAEIGPKTALGRLANNAHFMFGITINWKKPLPAASVNTLNTVTPIFENAVNLLQANNGYIICGGATADIGQVGTFANVWFYNVPGTQDQLVLASQPSGTRPCADPKQLGQTFTGFYYTNGAETPQQVRGVLLCLAQFTGKNAYIPLIPKGYAPGGNAPNPDNSRSVSGSLLHEMIHASTILTNKPILDQTSDTLFGDQNNAYGYARCATLGKKSQSQALANPDNFRIFAEMCMAPGTRWGTDIPPNFSAPPDKRNEAPWLSGGWLDVEDLPALPARSWALPMDSWDGIAVAAS